MLAKILAVVTFVFAMQAAATDMQYYSHKSRGAAKGADVVAYFDLQPGSKAVLGDESITHDWGGATWRFSSDENRQKFIDNPEKYAPQFGGYCAFAVAKGFTAPPRPDSWTIVEDKLYLNNNRTSHKIWLKKLEAQLEKGYSNWPAVLTK
jgi:hypothetical protein